jgi:hypothetical protein
MVQHETSPSVGWARRDTARMLTHVALLGVVAAGVLHIVGVPGIDIHGPWHYVGIMDPGCGGTRAMYLLSTGDFAGAAQYNPVVFPLAAGVLVMLARAVVGWTTGRWLTVRLSPRARRAVGVVVLALAIALWARQQLLADLMTQPWRP